MVALVDACAMKFSGCPEHIGLGMIIPDGAAGTKEAVSVTEAVAVVPALSTVTVYVTLVSAAVTVGDAHAVQLRPLGGAHEYVAPGGVHDTLSAVESPVHSGLTAADAVIVRLRGASIPVSGSSFTAADTVTLVACNSLKPVAIKSSKRIKFCFLIRYHYLVVSSLG